MEIPTSLVGDAYYMSPRSGMYKGIVRTSERQALSAQTAQNQVDTQRSNSVENPHVGIWHLCSCIDVEQKPEKQAMLGPWLACAKMKSAYSHWKDSVAMRRGTGV